MTEFSPSAITAGTVFPGAKGWEYDRLVVDGLYKGAPIPCRLLVAPTALSNDAMAIPSDLHVSATHMQYSRVEGELIIHCRIGGSPFVLTPQMSAPFVSLRRARRSYTLLEERPRPRVADGDFRPDTAISMPDIGDIVISLLRHDGLAAYRKNGTELQGRITTWRFPAQKGLA